MKPVLAGTAFFCCALAGGLSGGCAFAPVFSAADRQLERSFFFKGEKKIDSLAFDAALQAGADPNRMLNNGATPLIMVVLRDRWELIPDLIRRGAAVNGQGKRGSTPLHAAAGLGNGKCLNALLKAGAAVNAPGAFGRTALMEAARTGHVDIMRKLLGAGADIHARDKQGRTALIHGAEARENSLATVKFLLGAGADPMVFDSHAKLAVMHAAELRHTDTAAYLLDLIPEMPKKPALGLLIMHAAIQGGDLKIMEKLLDVRVPLNRSLSLALKGARMLQVHGFYRILIRNGLLDKGRMPIHWAAIANNLAAVKLLIARGADPLQEDELGYTADELATNREVIRYVRRKQKELLRKYRNND